MLPCVSSCAETHYPQLPITTEDALQLIVELILRLLTLIICWGITLHYIHPNVLPHCSK